MKFPMYPSTLPVVIKNQSGCLFMKHCIFINGERAA